MTIVAYRDGVIASDSMCAVGNHVLGFVEKIIKTEDRWLAGAAGDAGECRVFLDWVKKGRPGTSKPTIRNGDNDFEAFMVNPDGVIFHVGPDFQPVPIQAPFYAIGYSSIAIGAMAAGASSREAVSICCEYGHYCGGPIQAETLDVPDRSEPA